MIPSSSISLQKAVLGFGFLPPVPAQLFSPWCAGVKDFSTPLGIVQLPGSTQRHQPRADLCPTSCWMSCQQDVFRFILIKQGVPPSLPRDKDSSCSGRCPGQCWSQHGWRVRMGWMWHFGVFVFRAWSDGAGTASLHPQYPGPMLFATSGKVKLNAGKLLTSFQMSEVWEGLPGCFFFLEFLVRNTCWWHFWRKTHFQKLLQKSICLKDFF